MYYFDSSAQHPPLGGWVSRADLPGEPTCRPAPSVERRFLEREGPAKTPEGLAAELLKRRSEAATKFYAKQKTLLYVRGCCIGHTAEIPKHASEQDPPKTLEARRTRARCRPRPLPPAPVPAPAPAPALTPVHLHPTRSRARLFLARLPFR